MYWQHLTFMQNLLLLSVFNLLKTEYLRGWNSWSNKKRNVKMSLWTLRKLQMSNLPFLPTLKWLIKITCSSSDPNASKSYMMRSGLSGGTQPLLNYWDPASFGRESQGHTWDIRSWIGGWPYWLKTWTLMKKRKNGSQRRGRRHCDGMLTMSRKKFSCSCPWMKTDKHPEERWCHC